MRVLIVLCVLIGFASTLGAQGATTKPTDGGSTTQPKAGGSPDQPKAPEGETAEDPKTKPPVASEEIAKALDRQESLIYQLKVDRCKLNGKVTLDMGQGMPMASTFEYSFDRSNEKTPGTIKFADPQVGMYAQQMNFGAEALTRQFMEDNWRETFVGCTLKRNPDNAEVFEVLVESPEPTGFTSFTIGDNHLMKSQKAIQQTMMGPTQMDMNISWVQLGDKYKESGVAIDMQGGKVNIGFSYSEVQGYHVITNWGFDLDMGMMKASVKADLMDYRFGDDVDKPLEPKEDPKAEPKTGEPETGQPKTGAGAGSTTKPTSRPAGQ